MKSLRACINKLATKIFNVDQCISEMTGYQLLIELIVILVVILALSSPAWLPGLFSWNM
jgi:hypothetical protein